MIAVQEHYLLYGFSVTEHLRDLINQYEFKNTKLEDSYYCRKYLVIPENNTYFLPIFCKYA